MFSFIGGKSCEDGTQLKSVEAYDPETNNWFQVADMNEPHEECISVTYNGLLYVLGGYFYRRTRYMFKSSFECYDPKANKWTILEPICTENFQLGVGIDLIADDGWIIVKVNLKINKCDTDTDTTLRVELGDMRGKRRR